MVGEKVVVCYDSDGSVSELPLCNVARIEEDDPLRKANRELPSAPPDVQKCPLCRCDVSPVSPFCVCVRARVGAFSVEDRRKVVADDLSRHLREQFVVGALREAEGRLVPAGFEEGSMVEVVESAIPGAFVVVLLAEGRRQKFLVRVVVA